MKLPLDSSGDPPNIGRLWGGAGEYETKRERDRGHSAGNSSIRGNP